MAEGRGVLSGLFVLHGLVQRRRSFRHRCARQGHNLGRSPAPDDRHFPAAAIAKPESLAQNLQGPVVTNGLQLGGRTQQKNLALVEIAELLEALGIGALGQHGAPR